MTISKESKTILSERYANMVLISLLDGKHKMSDFLEVIKSQRTLEILISRLEGEELITVTKVAKPYKTTYLELTPHGYDVAMVLKKAQDVLNGLSEGEDFVSPSGAVFSEVEKRD